jgi:Ca-activated chloride channel homolog
MTCSVRATLAALVPLAILAAVAAGPAAAQPAAGLTENAQLVLVLDSSGSMAEPATGGTTKIAAAKAALRRVIGELPDQAQVGMRVYGSEVFESDAPGACEDTRLVVPPGTGNRAALRTAVGRYQPYGSTPIAFSLQQAAADLVPGGQRSILLVSDGEETCDPDPCATARAIEGAGIDLRIDVVGLQVGGTARSQLQCVAEAGAGTYYDAGSADELVEGMSRLATRAVEPFTLDGTPVVGTPTPEGAPELEASGTYTDTLTGGELHYTVSVAPGGTLFAGLAVRLGRQNAGLFDLNQAGISLRVPGTDDSAGAEGAECGRGSTSAVGEGRSDTIMSTVASSAGRFADEACATTDRLEVVVEGVSEGLAGQPVRLQLFEEPPATNAESLPGPADDPTWEPMSDTTPTALTPGTSFADAPTVTPGSWSFDLAPGELRLVRVEAGYGQRVQAQLTLGEADLPASYRTNLHVLGPLGGSASARRVQGEPEASKGDVALFSPGNVLTSSTPEIRYSHRSSGLDWEVSASTPGGYYVAVTMNSRFETEAVPVSMTLTVGVPGTAGEGAPTYAEAAAPTTAPSTPPAPSEPAGTRTAEPEDLTDAAPVAEEEGRPWALVGILVAVALLVGGSAAGVLIAARRR